MPIYVETFIRGPLDEVWRLTQTPELHERWDLRFSSITYLPRDDETAPQRFRYATRIGLGLEVVGWGETAGERVDETTRTSALGFGSEQRLALIDEGSGYWRYEQLEGGVRFLTGYDYRVRWGFAGRLVDRLAFRPAIGWATAWSFDRLRLWIEEGAEPARAARQALVHATATLAAAFTWVWHGLVPKLLGPHADELAMLAEAGVGEGWLRPAAFAVGGAEVLLGVALVAFAHRRWPWIVTLVLMVLATAGVLAASPGRALAAFGPVTLNLLLASIAAVGLLSLPGLPSARRCLRRPPAKPTAEAA